MFTEEISKIEGMHSRSEMLEYVVNPPTMQKIAFGTTLPRLVLPRSGPCLSSFMRAHQGDDPLSPGPAAYMCPSLLGFSAFAGTRLLPQRINKYGHGFLDEVPKPFKKAPKPFNVGAKRMHYSTFLTPPPSAYACDKPTLKLKISSAFGSEHKYIPHVEIKCFPHNIVVCAECRQTPIGDYWHNANDNQDICRTCMTAKRTIFHSCQIDNTKRRSLRHYDEEALLKGDRRKHLTYVMWIVTRWYGTVLWDWFEQTRLLYLNVPAFEKVNSTCNLNSLKAYGCAAMTKQLDDFSIYQYPVHKHNYRFDFISLIESAWLYIDLKLLNKYIERFHFN
ncbi:hypothetical protein GQX74_009068 [Glossina fuscipes]|nr:hypothetical protein GQX74_009068 [Glossina fuscipes]